LFVCEWLKMKREQRNRRNCQWREMVDIWLFAGESATTARKRSTENGVITFGTIEIESVLKINTKRSGRNGGYSVKCVLCVDDEESLVMAQWQKRRRFETMGEDEEVGGSLCLQNRAAKVRNGHFKSVKIDKWPATHHRHFPNQWQST